MSANTAEAHAQPGTRARPAPAPLLGVHPGIILAILDLIGLAIASYLSVVELGGGVPVCGPISGCEQVALSEYSRIFGIPVAVFGVALSLVLFVFAVAWWRTNDPRLLAVHYGLSLVGVLFEMYFLTVQIFVIEAVCVWCTMYGVSLIARFLIALLVWVRRPKVSEAPGAV